jgi:hypothetical protein
MFFMSSGAAIFNQLTCINIVFWLNSYVTVRPHRQEYVF